MLRRFRLEAETLGRLEHPGIARIYQAGTAQTAHGPQPFFAMELLDAAAFARLDAIGHAVRTGIDDAFRQSGVPGGTVGLGSLLKIHFADRPIRDYRSAYLTEQEAQRQAIFSQGLLNRGVLAAGYGLMALSTPMTDADVDAIIAAASGALAEVSASV